MDKRKKYNWGEIQENYDSGKSQRDLIKEFGCSWGAFTKAIKRGDFSSRNYSEAQYLKIKKYGPTKHTKQSKIKISIGRIKYLKENPDKNPFVKIGKGRGKSWLEKTFEEALVKEGLNNYQYNYQNGIYCYDFAWPEKKIDVEVDGGTHKQKRVKMIDIRRDKWSKSQGWIVLRFSYDEVKFDLGECIKKVKSIVED